MSYYFILVIISIYHHCPPNILYVIIITLMKFHTTHITHILLYLYATLLLLLLYSTHSSTLSYHNYFTKQFPSVNFSIASFKSWALKSISVLKRMVVFKSLHAPIFVVKISRLQPKHLFLHISIKSFCCVRPSCSHEPSNSHLWQPQFTIF